MQLSIHVGGQDVSAHALLDQTEIVRDSTDAISTATVVFWRAHGESVYGTAKYGSGKYAFRPKEWREITIPDQAGVHQFAGYITNIRQEAPPADLKQWQCTCADYGILLDRVYINATWPSGWSDRDIILDAFEQADFTGLPGEITVDEADIANIADDLGAFDAKDITLRELLERVCDLTGGEWRVDYYKGLHYYTAGTTAAPVAISDEVAMQHRLESVEEDSSRLANRITVLGGFDADGELSAVASNLESQAKYGILSATIVDRQLTDAATVTLRANAEVEQRAFPLRSGTFTTWQDGFDVGQTVPISNRTYGLNGSYLIRSIRIKQLMGEPDGIDRPDLLYCEYTVEFGARIPDLVSELRRAMQRPRQPAYEPVARPAPGSVVPGSLASTIGVITPVDSLPTLPDPSFGDNAVIFLTTNRKLYRRSGNTWTDKINAADIIDQLQAGQFAADSVTAGVIGAAAIRAVDAVFEAAAIKMADIDLVSAQRLIVGTANIDDAAITNAKIDRASVNKLTVVTADIADASITNLKVASGISASKMTTGTLDASVVNVININATNVTSGGFIGRTLTLTTGSVTTTVDNQAISSPIVATAGLAVSTGALTRTVVTEKGMFVFGGAVLPYAWAYTDATTGGVLQVYAPGFAGSVNITNGRVSVSSGFSVGAANGYTGSIWYRKGDGVSAGFITVSGGIITAVS